MKRRRFFQAMVVAPAAPVLLAPPPARAQSSAGTPPGDDLPKIEATSAEQAADAIAHFFDVQQLSALRKLAELLMPPMNGLPGASEAQAAEFLDFLIGSSAGERQQIYRAGLNALNAEALKKHGKTFANLDEAQAHALLAPLRAPWTYELPADPLARFLITAKQDVRTATVNSREWNTAPGTGGRRVGGTGLYWYSLD